MTRRAPNECPRCRSRQVERFPDSTLYDCGFALFDDGTPVADDYPDECNYRRIKLLEHQLSRSRAEAERWKQQYEELRAGVERVEQDLRKRAYSCARDWLETGHRYHDGASDAYYEAARMVRLVRRLLTEAGGGDT